MNLRSTGPLHISISESQPFDEFNGSDETSSMPLDVADTRARMTALEGFIYFVIATGIDCIRGFYHFPSVLKGSLINPDSYMRLVRLHETLAQHAAAYIVTRDASGAGMLLYWSHLLDSILLLLAAPLMPLMSEQQALHWAAVAFGPISIGLLAVAIA